MTQNEIKFVNIVKAICAPFIYYFIMMGVQSVMDIYLFYSQVKSMNGRANAAASYTFMETYGNNMEKYAYLVTFFSALIAVAAFGIAYRKEIEGLEKGRFIKELQYNNIKMISLIVGLGIFGSLGLGRFVSMLPLDNIVGNYEETSALLLGGKFIMQIISVGIIVPIAEELIYRGLVFNELCKLTNRVYAMLLSALIFGIFHFNLLQGTYAFLLGILLVCVYIKTESILMSILLHSTANILSIILTATGISELFNRSMIFYFVVMIIELGMGYLIFELIIAFDNKKYSGKKSEKISGNIQKNEKNDIK